MKTYKNIYTLKNFLPESEYETSELKETPLYKLYKPYFDTECVDLVDSYGSFFTCYPIEDEKNLPSNLMELYKKFERNLILLCDKSKEFTVQWENKENKLCFYLKYWIYDQLISNNVSEVHFSQFFKIWNENKGKNYPECKCKFKNTILSNVKLLKQAYDYFLFLEAYGKTAKIHDKVSTMNYCKYIVDAKAVYSSFPLICESRNTEYCQEFKKYISPYMKEDDDKSILCETDLKYNPDQEEQEKVNELLRKIKTRKETVQLKDTNEMESRGDTDQESETRGHNGQEEEAQVHRFLKPEATIGDQAHLLPFQKEGYAAHDVSSTELPIGEDGMTNTILGTNPPDNGSPMKTVASATLFSPVRTWIDPRIRKTKRELKNSVQGSNELQSYDYNFDTTNMDFNRFNVGYQSR
ncbi:hypothetical protein PVBG_05681 [Plasmodium vivax Brazil I]|uniref:VIR protein n=1 Tax=Plasmodium vivax (strain Brazil I) TaxID=1033975 RepID=A0A0J9T002_PLAV1|nr:hypothetical protein PVBG_05681 [Plasmodium vivax Brazil I]